LATPRNLETLVDAQVRRWEARERAVSARAAEGAGGACVAFSRLPGAGGSEIARRVAAQLDYGLFDREIVDEIARERGAERQLVAGLDEHVRGAIDRHIMDFLRRRHGVTEQEYLEALVRVVKTLGRRGATVIVGRGAPFVLSEQEALRVLLVASREVRLDRFAASRGIPPEQAAPLLDQEEARRREFVEHHFHLDQTDPQRYDIVLNTGTLGIGLAADLVVTAWKARFADPPQGSR
jgi:cytidylate kinase